MRRNAIRIASAAGLFLAAAAAGFLLSSQFGHSLIRSEVEKQFARLMRGEAAVESARLVVGDGLWLKAGRVDVYPAWQGERAGLPTLSAERVAARIDVLAVLTGRLRLRALEIDGLRLQLERFADGSWSFPPLQTLLRKRPVAEPGDLEQYLGVLKATDALTRTLLARPIVANRIELHFGTVTFVDHAVSAPGEEPVTLYLRGIEGRLEHNWLAGEADLSLRAQLADSVGRRSSIELSGRRRDEQRVAFAVTDLPLSLLGPYLASSGPQASADGTLSGVVAYRAPTADHGVLELDWLIRTLDMSVPLRAEPLHIESPRLELHSRIEIHPGRLRVAELKLEGLGGAGELTTRGVVERPLRESSRARLSTTLRGAGLAELRRIVAWLPETDATPLTELLARLESGRIERIEASGGARVSQWRRLARGELKSLPSGFVLTTDVAGVAVASDGPAALTDLGAHAEWSGDRISLRELSANWRGVPLARVDLTVEGLSNLLGGPASSRKLRPGAEPIPGLMTLWRIVAGGPREGPAAPLPVMQLAIEALDHPGLRWPIRDTRVHIASTLRGVAIEASDGTWAGAPFRAEALWTRQPEPHWKVEVAVAAPASHTRSSPAGRPRENEIGSTDERADAWLRGELRVDSLEAAGLPTSKFEARFGLAGTSLSLSEVRAELMPEGELTGGLVVDLSESQRLPAKVDVQMLDGDLSQIAPMVGLEREQWSGRLSFRGGLEGWVAPERPLLTELSGSVYVQAREGELQREIPMVLAIAQATEGFNPFASRSVARFESVEMTLRLDRGRISTDNLELEGPIRAHAKGFLDVARPDPKVNVVVGIFLFRQADQTLGQLPLLSQLVSDQGLVGGYFEVDGSAADPEVRGLPLDSIASAIPDVVKAPFRALRAIGRFLDGDADAPPPAKPSPDWPDSKDDWLRDIGRGS